MAKTVLMVLGLITFFYNASSAQIIYKTDFKREADYTVWETRHKLEADV